MDSNLKLSSSQIKKSFSSTKLIIYSSSPFFLFLIIFHYQASPFTSFSSSPASGVFFQQWKGEAIDSLNAKLRDSVTFLPLKDLRFRDSAMEGNTWFMSSLNDTLDEDGSQYLYFPSRASKSRILCIGGRDTKDGSKNSYALAWPEALPENSTLLRGLTFISDTYYNHDNLWHGVGATAPFVGWSMKNGCSRPERWVLFHWGELRIRMGSWVQRLMEAYYGNVKTEKFDGGDGPYCFEKAVVVRHDLGNMSLERKLKVCELLRCRAREACGVNLKGREREVNERGVPLIRLTLLMRRGSRSFKNATVVSDIFAKECERVDGCVLKVSQSEDLSFCDQVL